ncbi:hypothetical protein TNCV_3821211 [Trichonephila clavipes]|nr:hypothetical protein TNCV_3821211 [Trichonephila clavipes]
MAEVTGFFSYRLLLLSMGAGAPLSIMAASLGVAAAPRSNNKQWPHGHVDDLVLAEVEHILFLAIDSSLAISFLATSTASTAVFVFAHIPVSPNNMPNHRFRYVTLS